MQDDDEDFLEGNPNPEEDELMEDEADLKRESGDTVSDEGKDLGMEEAKLQKFIKSNAGNSLENELE